MRVETTDRHIDLVSEKDFTEIAPGVYESPVDGRLVVIGADGKSALVIER